LIAKLEKEKKIQYIFQNNFKIYLCTTLSND